MSEYVLIFLNIAVWYTNGFAAPNTFVLPGDAVCNRGVALQYVNDFIVPNLPPGFQIQDPTKEDNLSYSCVALLPGPGPGEGALPKPREPEFEPETDPLTKQKSASAHTHLGRVRERAERIWFGR